MVLVKIEKHCFRCNNMIECGNRNREYQVMKLEDENKYEREREKRIEHPTSRNRRSRVVHKSKFGKEA